jgi:hypothetical protein
VSALPRRDDDAIPIAATRRTQIPTVRHGCLLDALASDSGLSLRNTISPSPLGVGPARVNLHCILTA